VFRSFDELRARQFELAVRAGALVLATLGGPTCALLAALAARPSLFLGTVATSAPLAVVRLIPAPAAAIREVANHDLSPS
jgi:hypothetical protein